MFTPACILLFVKIPTIQLNPTSGSDQSFAAPMHNLNLSISMKPVYSVQYSSLSIRVLKFLVPEDIVRKPKFPGPVTAL